MKELDVHNIMYELTQKKKDLTDVENRLHQMISEKSTLTDEITQLQRNHTQNKEELKVKVKELDQRNYEITKIESLLLEYKDSVQTIQSKLQVKELAFNTLEDKHKKRIKWHKAGVEKIKNHVVKIKKLRIKLKGRDTKLQKYKDKIKRLQLLLKQNNISY